MINLTNKIYYLLTDEKCSINFLNNYDALQCAKMIVDYIIPNISDKSIIQAHWVQNKNT